MTASTADLAYFLTTSYGINSEIEGSQNKVDKKQKALVNVDFLSTGKETFSIWTGLGFEVFEWLCISVMTVLFAYSMVKKILVKQGLIQKLKARRAKSKLYTVEKMESILRKQGIIVNEEVKEDEAEPNEQKPAEPKVKFYGKEALAAV